MNDAAITVSQLRKSYGPDNLTFSVPRGVISGFLGPNGSGKTTTLRILMGFAHAAAGGASLLGIPAGSTHEIFRRVAFVPEVKELYPNARAGEMIRLTKGFYPDFDDKLAKQLVDEFEIPVRKLCQKLSKGIKAKLCLLLALCRRPELLVLDEPTDGLDPVGIERALQLLVQQVSDNNATVFFSSHQLPEVEQISDHIVMIKQGRCVVEGDIDEIKNRFRRVRCMIEADDFKLPQEFSGWQRDGRILTGFSSDDASTLTTKFGGSGISLLEAERASLKDIFLEKMSRA